MELFALPAHQLRTMLDQGEIRSVDIVESALSRIEETDGEIGAYISVRADEARREAEEADRRLKEGRDVGPLTGIPVSLKDNICVSDWPTTCASKILEDFRPPYDATVAARLKEAGAPIIGKLNLDEFAMGSSTETSAFKVTRNPWDMSRVPGGSSGGAAAAIAAQSAVLALGSDTGGSIRQPASFCGAVGLKPTYGRVSRFGLISFSSSLDHIGPMASNVRDTARLLSVIAGHDPLDSTSNNQKTPDYEQSLEAGVSGLVIGMPKEYFGEDIAPDVKEAVKAAVRTLEAEGAKVEEVSLPHTKYALASFYMIAPAEASSNLGRFDGVRFGLRAKDAEDVVAMFKETRRQGFGPEVKRRIMLGVYALSSGQYDAYYQQALKVRTLIRRDFEQAFQKCDVLATPTTPSVAFSMGERADNPMDMYKADLCTVPANLAGIPALSLPCGLNSDGLPIGLQLLGPPLSEERLLQTAYAYEQAAGLLPLRPRPEVK